MAFQTYVIINNKILAFVSKFFIDKEMEVIPETVLGCVVIYIIKFIFQISLPAFHVLQDYVVPFHPSTSRLAIRRARSLRFIGT